MNTIHIAIADKDYLVADSLARHTEREDDVTVTGVFTDIPALTRSIESEHTDVVLIDPSGLSEGPIDALRRLRGICPDVRLVVVTADQGEPFFFAAVRMGIYGLLSKSVGLDEVISAIRTAARGEATLTPQDARRLMEEYARKTEPEVGLTRRQCDILQGIVQGKTNREIARDLCLSEKTVKNYMSELYASLEVRDRTGAALRALNLGIVPNERAAVG